MFDDKDPFVKDFGFAGRDRTRRALEKLGGADDFRSGYIWTPNGWVLMRTHGGLPRTYPVDLKPVEEEEVIPDYHVFQVATLVDIAWPATPFATTWTGDHWLSNDPKIVLTEETVTARGNCEWFGYSTHVVTWFGLNSSGRQASTTFFHKRSGFSRYWSLPHALRATTQREAVWVDGEKWFDLPTNRAPMCAAMCGDLLRVIAVDTSSFAGAHARFAKDGTAGNNVAEETNGLLYLYEGTADSMIMMRTVTIDSGPYNLYTFLQSFFFSPDGEKAVGIVGIKEGMTVTVTPRIIEIVFSTGEKSINRIGVQTVGTEYGDLEWEIKRPTGLPDGGEVVVAKASGDPSGVSSPGNSISASGIQYVVAAEYKHATGELVFLYRKEYNVFGDPITQDYASALVADFEYYSLTTGGICDANHASISAAYALKGWGPPDNYGVGYGPVPGDGTPSGGGEYGWSPTGGGLYTRRDYVWGVKKRFHNYVGGSRSIKDIHYVRKDADGNDIGDFFSRQGAIRHTRAYNTSLFDGFLSEPYEVVPTTGYTGGDPNIPFDWNPIMFSNPTWQNGQGSSENTVLIDRDEEDDGFDIVACDLRTDTYVVQTPTGRNVVRGFPTHKSGNWIPGVLSWTTKTDPEDGSIIEISDLVAPFFGIECLTAYNDGNHLVFSESDAWGGGTTLAHWSPSTGKTIISEGAPHEGAIYFRGKPAP